MHHARTRSLLLGACLFSLSAQAIPVLDQNQDSAGGRLAAFAPQATLAQSFRQTNNTLSGAGIFLTALPGFTDTVTISLWDALPGQSGANRLASASGVAQHDAWLDVYWSPVHLSPATEYFLVFSSVGNVFSLAGNRTNPYASGQAYGGTAFTPISNGDYSFRTYYDRPTSPVPEPASWALFGAGMALIALARTRRRGSAR